MKPLQHVQSGAGGGDACAGTGAGHEEGRATRGGARARRARGGGRTLVLHNPEVLLHRVLVKTRILVAEAVVRHGDGMGAAHEAAKGGGGQRRALTAAPPPAVGEANLASQLELPERV